MRLKHILIEGFRGFVRQAEIDLSADVIILHGPNGVGKTSLLDAILWALTGEITRFSASGGPVSLYAREGIARVVLTLSAPTGDVVITRLHDGKEGMVRVSHSGEEFDGASAEGLLGTLLLPRGPEGGARASLTNVITRAVYLQQDLVRQFVETDTPAERFELLSDVIGAGVILDLQRSLERSRNLWSRNTNALRKDKLDPAQARLKQISDQLSRLASDPANIAIDARAAAADVFRRAQAMIGSNRLSLTEPPVSSSSLDRLLKEISAARARAERELSTAVSLSEETVAVGSQNTSDAPALQLLERRDAALAEEIKVLDRNLQAALDDLSRQRHRLVESQSRIARLATLARLAIEDLGDVCPVCEQTHNQMKTRRHLAELISAAEVPPESLRDGEDAVADLALARSDKQTELEGIRAEILGARASQREALARRDLHFVRLQDAGIALEGDIAAHLAGKVQALRGELSNLNELLRDGENLSLGVVRLGEERRRAEFVAESLTITAEIETATQQIAAQDRTHRLAGEIIDGLRDASLEVTKKQIESVAPLFQRIYSRIDPHPTFRVTQIIPGMRGGKGLLKIGVSDPDQGEASHEALPILSSSQLNSFAVSLFLSLNLALPSLKLSVTILDDPLQSLDSINLLGLVDVLRRFRAHRQIIVSTHEPRLLGLLQRKLRPVKDDERMDTIVFDDWDQAGPNYRVSSAERDASVGTVLAA